MAEYIRSMYFDVTLTLFRIVTGFLFIPHGAQKLFGWLGGMGGKGTTAGFPELMWFAGVLEFFGGICILFGIFTRPVAFLLSGQMAVAYFKAHAPQGFLPIINHGELAVLYCFIFLFLSAVGSGPLAVERLWKKNKR